MSKPAFKPGDRVRGKTWPGQFGTLGKVNAKTAIVQWDGRGTERVHLEWLIHETAEDVAMRERGAAMAAWRRKRPATIVASIDYNQSWHRANEEIGARVTARTPADMRQAADELHALADWFEQRPKESK